MKFNEHISNFLISLYSSYNITNYIIGFIQTNLSNEIISYGKLNYQFIYVNLVGNGEIPFEKNILEDHLIST